MNVLVLSDTFPNALAPWRGPYNRQQIECLSKYCRLTVINPFPWPRMFMGKQYRALIAGPDNVLDGIPLYHPVFWYLPVVGRNTTWRGVTSATERTLRKYDLTDFDVVLATFAYVHGPAARQIARNLGVPYVIKTRGSDLHTLPARGERRERTAEALRDASAVAAVSRNLADIVVELGASPDRIHLLPNGIDVATFDMIPREEARARVGFNPEEKLLFFAGNLLPVKGLDVLLDAVQLVRDRLNAKVVIAGTGPLRATLERTLVKNRLHDRVTLLGSLSRTEIATWMNAADALVLPSRNEGCPNVVLEALCCGTPVVASRVGAVPDFLDETRGIMFESESTRALAQALLDVLAKNWDRAAIRSRVEDMSWEKNAADLHRILTQACE